MSDHRLKCRQCQGSDFNLQDGLYFCNECGIQIENLVAMEHEETVENMQAQHRVKLTSDKKKQKDNLKARRLTSWEEYNHILIGLVNEVLIIQPVPGFKVTCLQLWIAYLRSTEAAFFSQESSVAPKLFAIYRQADAEILYNKKSKEKKSKAKRAKVEPLPGEEGDRQRQIQMRKSEKIISQELNESAKSESLNTSLLANLSLESIKSDHENAELDIEWSKAGKKMREKKLQKGKDKIKTTKLSRLENSHVLTGSTLLHIIYCALNICGSELQLSDLIRFVREGHLSFFKLRQFLPDEIIELDVPLSFQEYHSYRMINYEYTRKLLTYFVRIVPDLVASFRTPNLVALTRRYIEELALPFELGDYIERLMIFLPPEMKFRLFAPNYEGRAMAFVLFVLKLLFGIDGYREIEISTSARQINKTAKPQKTIFVYEDWRMFIEYRQVILGKFYYPTLLFHHDASTDRPYLAFNAMLETLNPKTRCVESQIVNAYNEKRMRAKTAAAEMLTELAKAHKDSTYTQFSFHSSLTPLKDNFQHILCHNSEVKINRKIADVDHSTHTLEPFLRPQKLVDELADKGIELHTKKTNFPKCFAFSKPAKTKEFMKKETFELKIGEVTTDDWRDNLKKQQEMDEEEKLSAAEEFHRKQFSKVLIKRKFWRRQIKTKKQFGRNFDSDAIEINNDAKEFHELDVLSESEDEEIDLHVDEINLNDNKKQDNREFVLIVPDYNVWQHFIYMSDVDARSVESELDKLPNSFQWLLKLGASVLHQHPVSVYQQLQCIEHQFMEVYQPIELMQNVLLKQKLVEARAHFRPRSNQNLEMAW